MTNTTESSGKRQVVRPVFGPEANAMVFERLLKIMNRKIEELCRQSSVPAASPAMDELRERLYPPDWSDNFKPSFGSPFSFGILVIIGTALLFSVLSAKNRENERMSVYRDWTLTCEIRGQKHSWERTTMPSAIRWHLRRTAQET